MSFRTITYGSLLLLLTAGVAGGCKKNEIVFEADESSTACELDTRRCLDDELQRCEEDGDERKFVSVMQCDEGACDANRTTCSSSEDPTSMGGGENADSDTMDLDDVLPSASCDKFRGVVDLVLPADVGEGTEVSTAHLSVPGTRGAFIAVSVGGDTGEGFIVARQDQDDAARTEFAHFTGRFTPVAGRVREEQLELYGRTEEGLQRVSIALDSSEHLGNDPQMTVTPVPSPGACSETGASVRDVAFSFEGTEAHFMVGCESEAGELSLHVSSDLEAPFATGSLSDPALSFTDYFRRGDVHLAQSGDGAIRYGNSPAELSTIHTPSFQEGGTSRIELLTQGPLDDEVLAFGFRSERDLTAPFPLDLVAAATNVENASALAQSAEIFSAVQSFEEQEGFASPRHAAVGEHGVFLAAVDRLETQIHLLYSTRTGELLSPLSAAYEAPEGNLVSRSRAAVTSEPGNMILTWAEEVADAPGGPEIRIRGQRMKCL